MQARIATRRSARRPSVAAHRPAEMKKITCDLRHIARRGGFAQGFRELLLDGDDGGGGLAVVVEHVDDALERLA